VLNEGGREGVQIVEGEEQGVCTSGDDGEMSVHEEPGTHLLSGSDHFWKGGALLLGGKDEVVEVDLVRGRDGLVQLPNGRDGRQLVLLLTLSIKSSLWVQVRQREVQITKDA